MHSNLLLGTTLTAAALAYVFKPRKPKTELEASSVPTPSVPSYLPFQIDTAYRYMMSAWAGKELEYLRSITSQHGNTLNIKTFNQDSIIVLDPQSIKHILSKNQPNYEKGPEVNAIFHDLLGTGIFSADGEVWKTQRQLARPHFQTSEFKDAALINRHVDILIKVLDKRIAANPGKPLEIQSFFTRFTLDEATEFLFGEAVHSQEEEEGSTFGDSFNNAQSITAWRFRVSLWRYLVPDRRLHEEVKILDDFVYRIIDNAIKRQEEQEKNPFGANDEKERHANLLDHFLAAKRDHGFTRKYLRDMLLNFLLAGRDTVRSSS
ncbi:hypothetical protein BGX31_009335 [Mortierella sp. GBA43]|nr:hypothetical protein BGX31_009335 [Mortierella sp. GBA43]